MKLIDFLNDRRTELTLREYWNITFCFDDVLNEETSIYNQIKMGYNFDEYYLDNTPFSKYYKRFGNLVKNLSETIKNKEVKSIEVGCSGRKFCATYSLTIPEKDTLDKFFKGLI